MIGESSLGLSSYRYTVRLSPSAAHDRRSLRPCSLCMKSAKSRFSTGLKAFLQ